jgi:hypothetical protein
VSDGGDNTDWDHADWIAPMLYKGTDSLSLTSIKWTKATSGWGQARVNKGVSGSELIVDDQKYENGIGTHSNSLVEFDLPEGYTRFKAMVGLDKACVVQNTGATVKFMVFTQNPSGPKPADSTQVKVQLKDLDFNTSCKVKDLWTGKQVGTFNDEFAPYIRRHGAGLYRITPQKKN